MNDTLIYAGIYIFGVIISSLSQILLKKSARIEHKSTIREYLNPRVISAYTIFVIATFCTVYAYKVLPLSWGPILGATEYVFIAILSYVFLKEKIGLKKFIGLTMIVLGVVIVAL